MKYIAPDALVVPLGYDWDPYESVYPFCSTGRFKDVAQWYVRNVPDCENTNDEKGKFEAYFEDPADSSEWSVLLADASTRPAKEDFFCYVACSKLEELAEEKKYRTVGVLFRHKRKPEK